MPSVLDELPEPTRGRVLQVARRRTFARNEVVFHRDDPGDTCHIVRKGRFAVRVPSRHGDVVTLAILGPGDSFGELALLSEESRRTATVVALEAAETTSIHALDFNAVLEEHPQAMLVVVQILRARVERLSGLVAEALFEPVDRRIVRRLAELADLYADGDGAGADIPLTQELIGELAGASRSTVNRVLRGEEQRGLVVLRRGRTVVPDRAALRARADRR